LPARGNMAGTPLKPHRMCPRFLPPREADRVEP
jgi:hypothetical protein